jgi:hypothetical protein
MEKVASQKMLLFYSDADRFLPQPFLLLACWKW